MRVLLVEEFEDTSLLEARTQIDIRCFCVGFKFNTYKAIRLF